MQHNLEVWSQGVCTVSWVVALVLLLRVRGIPRVDLQIGAVLAVSAFAIRFILPWGPLNHVDAERLKPLWSHYPNVVPEFATVSSALGFLKALGVPPATLLHVWGPVMGASAAVATFACARAFSLERGPAALAGVIVAALPAHVHYSTAPMLSVEAGGLSVAALAVAAFADIGIVTIPLLTAFVTLAVYARPECRFIILPVAALVLGPKWTWRRRLILAGCLTVALAGYVPIALHPEIAANVWGSRCMSFFFRSMFTNPLAFGGLWAAAALAELVWGSGAPRQRVALALALLPPLAIYWTGATDPSPQWGQSRYYAVIVPVIAILAALFVAKLSRPATSKAILAGCLVLAVAPLATNWRALHARNNEQAAFEFVRDTVQAQVPPEATIYLLATESAGVPQSSAVLGLAAAYGGVNGPDILCDQRPSTGFPGPAVRVLDVEMHRCPDHVLNDGAILFLGLEREEKVTAEVRKQFDLIPLFEQTSLVVPDTVSISTTNFHVGCSNQDLTGADYKATFGWYRLKKRT